MSIAAAIAFSLEAGLQGLVLDSGAVQQQQPAIAAARSKGLKVGPHPSIDLLPCSAQLGISADAGLPQW